MSLTDWPVFLTILFGLILLFLGVIYLYETHISPTCKPSDSFELEEFRRHGDGTKEKGGY